MHTKKGFENRKKITFTLCFLALFACQSSLHTGKVLHGSASKENVPTVEMHLYDNWVATTGGFIPPVIDEKDINFLSKDTLN